MQRPREEQLNKFKGQNRMKPREVCRERRSPVSHSEWLGFYSKSNKSLLEEF